MKSSISDVIGRELGLEMINVFVRHRVRKGKCLTLVLPLLALFLGSCRRPVSDPTVLKYLRPVWVPANELPAETILSLQFKKETGISFIQMRGVQENALDQLAFTRTELSRQASGPDVLEIDPAWLPLLQDNLIDLKPLLGQELGPLNPALAASYQPGGRLLAIPYQKGVGVLEFRSDLLSSYGYPHPPQSWDELERMASRIQAGERAKGHRRFWGYVWPGAAAESLTCNGLEWQLDEGGGNILEAEKTVSVNNPGVLKAWKRASRWVGWISPPNVTTYRESDAASVFDSGNAAFMRQWGGEPGRLAPSNGVQTARLWGLTSPLDRIGFAPLPGGTVDRVAVIGGMGLAISRSSTHQTEDTALIRFLLRAQIRSMEDGTVQHLTPAVVSYDALATGPQKHIEGRSKTLPPRIVSRPVAVAGQHYERVTKEYSDALHAVLHHDISAEHALVALETKLIEITGFRSGVPR